MKNNIYSVNGEFPDKKGDVTVPAPVIASDVHYNNEVLPTTKPSAFTKGITISKVDRISGNAAMEAWRQYCVDKFSGFTISYSIFEIEIITYQAAPGEHLARDTFQEIKLFDAHEEDRKLYATISRMGRVYEDVFVGETICLAASRSTTNPENNLNGLAGNTVYNISARKLYLKTTDTTTGVAPSRPSNQGWVEILTTRNTASRTVPGIVMPDDNTIKVNSSGVISVNTSGLNISAGIEHGLIASGSLPANQTGISVPLTSVNEWSEWYLTINNVIQYETTEYTVSEVGENLVITMNTSLQAARNYRVHGNRLNFTTS